MDCTKCLSLSSYVFDSYWDSGSQSNLTCYTCRRRKLLKYILIELEWPLYLWDASMDPHNTGKCTVGIGISIVTVGCA